jgi:hypothetical protein
MDFQRAQILLDKINALFKSMGVDQSNIASIEKDLMQSYIKQLYEIFMQIDIDQATPSSFTPPPPPLPKKKIEILKEEPKKAPTPPREPSNQPPRIIEVPEELIEEVPAAPEPKAEPKPVPKAEPVKPSPADATPPVKSNTYGADGEVEVLFEQPEVRELSERLEQLPISDLSKAMGLNERIFTINELFGGDQGAFSEVVDALNKLDSFEEARAYLTQQVVDKYGWASKQKKKKAKNFIKLVRRRYNNN